MIHARRIGWAGALSLVMLACGGGPTLQETLIDMDRPDARLDELLPAAIASWEGADEAARRALADKLGRRTLAAPDATDAWASALGGSDREPALTLVYRGAIPALMRAGIERERGSGVSPEHDRLNRFFYVEQGIADLPDFRERFRRETLVEAMPVVLSKLEDDDPGIGLNALEMVVNLLADERMSDDAAEDTRVILELVSRVEGLGTRRKLQIAYAVSWMWTPHPEHAELVESAEAMGKSLTYSNVDQLGWLNELRSVGGGVAILGTPVVIDAAIRLYESGEDRNRGIWALAHTYGSLRKTLSSGRFDSPERVEIQRVYSELVDRVRPVLVAAGKRDDLDPEVMKLVEQALR